MEHITVTDMGNGYFKLVPDQGYVLLDNRNYFTYAVAVVKYEQIKYFSAEEVNE